MIRFFKKEDWPFICTLGDQISNDFSKTNHLEELENDGFTRILVYEKEEKIIGFLMYIELPETVDILDIIVEEHYRNKNVASCLLDYMLGTLNKSVKLITLEVRKSNIPAIKLYEKFGFSIFHTRKQYYKTEDAYLMGRRIEG